VTVVALRTLRNFWQRYPQAEAPLRQWYKAMNVRNYANFAELRAAFPAVDYAPPFTIFDVGGNKYRLVTIIDYPWRFVKIRHVFTHSEYDRWNRQGRPNHG
jgi:mRNA interferase HigB